LPPGPAPPAKRPASVVAASAAVAKNEGGNSPNKQRRLSHLHIKAPVILRDVTVFQRRQQVGEGTYGYVSHHSFVETTLLYLEAAALFLLILL
jgi:hypothetical protein